jgi:hypothetical protein
MTADPLSEVGAVIKTDADESDGVTSTTGADVTPMGVAVAAVLVRPHAVEVVPASTTKLYSVPFVNDVIVVLHVVPVHAVPVAIAVPFTVEPLAGVRLTR